ncbi:MULTISPECIES: nucleoside/nucleotide kinase family protein [unclassified Pseudonocardia]|uniref:nucleoside/nucleotide kinase family protein n=2 Tax=unclassified Pseudonocardia TaxID=2619320 RepID=UPI0009F87BB6|nr:MULTISPECIES: nucleoside/nucleotide kinase family protein [unclassified Pseudonocardia]
MNVDGDGPAHPPGDRVTADGPDALARRAVRLLGDRPRVLIGLAGSPGSGKTTLAAALAERLGPAAVALPMDGFHLANVTLDRLGRRDRKGAVDTFDGAGFAALLDRVTSTTGETVYAPGFDRAVDEPVAGSIAIEPGHRIVLVEGNYLLVPDEPWARIRPLLAAAWFVGTPEDERLRRLVERHTRHGRTAEAARAWARDVDGANADLIESTRRRADLVVPGTAGAGSVGSGPRPRPAAPSP